MLIVVNRLNVPEEARARIEQGFQHASGMKDVPGCLGFELWRSNEGQEYQVVTRWRGRADFDAWRNSEAFARAHGDTRGTESVQSQLITYDVVIGG